MKTKWREIIAVVVALLLISLVISSFAVWDNDLPGDNTTWNDAMGMIRDNWDALEAALGVDLANVSTAGGVDIHNVKNTAYGAVGDGATDDSAAVQAAVDAAIAQTYGGAVYFPPGKYLLKTEISIVNGGNKGLRVFGAGGHATRIVCPTSASGNFTGDAIFEINCTGPGTQFSDFVIGSDTGGNFDVSAIKATGNGILFENLWIHGCNNGLYLYSATNIRVSNVLAELNRDNFKVDSSDYISFTNCHTYQGVFSGFYLTGQKTLSGSETQAAITLSGCVLTEDGTGGDGSKAAIYITTNVLVNIGSTHISSFNNKWPQIGIRLESGASKVTVSNTVISHCKIAGIKIGTNATLVIDGCLIYRIGYYDQSSPWVCYGIFWQSSIGFLIVSNTEISDCAGYGIYTNATYNQFTNVLFKDCVQGGSDGGGVNATIGNKVLLFDPQQTYATLQLSNCTFEALTGSSAGKTAIFIDNTAIPVASNLKFIGNHIVSGHFATNFGSDLTDTQLAGQDFFANYPLQPNYIAILDNTGTPTVKNIKIALSGGTTTITDFDDGVEGQTITIIGAHSLTITDGTNIILDGGANMSMTSGDTLMLIQLADTYWYQLSESNNN